LPRAPDRLGSDPAAAVQHRYMCRVRVSQAVGFHRALRDQDATVEVVIYPREPHLVHERSHQRDRLHRLQAWYDRWFRDATAD
jgi:dipeptidyl aminopeptidase/acylaminoacyl peptidase